MGGAIAEGLLKTDNFCASDLVVSDHHEQVLKHFALDVTGTRPVSEAIVTAGGVKVGEVAPNTMASKRVDGLYFAGEVLDVDAYTGGFNLQIAWATGYLAGLSAAESEEMYD